MSNVAILPFTDENLYACLANQWTQANTVRDSPQASYLYHYLTRLRASTIVVEEEYVDRDFLADYSSFYVDSFPSYERHCKRVHFFSNTISSEAVRDLIKSAATETDAMLLQEAYLGFIVARPLGRSVIGRSILASYDENFSRRYPVTRQYEPHLFGIRLPINSLAFQQQDSVVAACATVALWSAFHKTQRLFDSRRPTPAEITEAANAIPGAQRSMPSNSLSVEQMGQAIRYAGLEPEYVTVTDRTPLTSMLYGYLSMGVPAILLFTFASDADTGVDHAVTVTGYSYGTPTFREQDAILKHRGRTIDQFFVHDDQVGPFAHMKIVEHHTPLTTLREQNAITSDVEAFLSAFPYGLEWERRSADGSVDVRLVIPLGFVIPLDKLIRLKWDAMHTWLTDVNAALLVYKRAFKFSIEGLDWDLRLSFSNAYKADLRLRALGTKDAQGLTLESYPKYIWVATASIDNQPIFELTADATCVPDTFPFLHILYFDEGMKEQLLYIFSHDEVVDAYTETRGRRMVNFLTGRDRNDGIVAHPHRDQGEN